MTDASLGAVSSTTSPTLRYLLAAAVLLHLIGNIWHGDAHTTLEISLPTLKTAFVIVVIIVAPLVGMIMLWTRFMTYGAWLIAASMLGSVLFSVYHHYVMISNDNVEHLPVGTPEAHAHFANSAAAIALLALAGALLACYVSGSFRKSENSA